MSRNERIIVAVFALGSLLTCWLAANGNGGPLIVWTIVVCLTAAIGSFKVVRRL